MSDRLRVFVSSKMEELSEERAVVKAKLDELNIDAWVFEQDAGARPEAIQDSYRDELVASDLYVGIFWKGYGAYTVDEFEYAQKQGRDCLVYLKGGDKVSGRDPQLSAFLKRIGSVETGITIQFFQDAAELGEMVKRDAVRWQTRIVRKSREGAQRGPHGGLGADTNLAALGRKVQHAWIDGVLARTTGSLIDVAMEVRPEATEGGFEAVLELPDEGSRVVGSDSTPLQIYDQVRGSLLILGHAGSGKTTTALRITRELLRRWARDDSLAVPVVLNLSAWTADAPSLLTWIARELRSKYQVPGRISRPWLEQHRLALVLDGLDEVAAGGRQACVEAINTFCEDFDPGGLVVTSRLEEYEVLPVKLVTNGAISLQPLGPAQIDAYLEETGDALAGLRDALKKDEVLQGLARSPLMLSVMSLAYRDRSAGQIEQSGAGSADVRRANLFETYLDRAFELSSRDLAFSRGAVTSWLSWIAKGLSHRAQTVFLIEELQPSWLAKRRELVVFLGGFAVLFGLVGAGLIILFRVTPMRPVGAATLNGAAEAIAWIGGCVVWLLALSWVEGLRSFDRRRRSPPGARDAWMRLLLNLGVFGALWTPILPMVWATQGACATAGDKYGVPLVLTIAASVFSARRSLSRSIRTTESLGLEWFAARRGAMWGMLIGVGLALPPFLDDPPRYGEGVVWWLLAVVLCAILGGYRPRVVKGKSVPNQGMLLTLGTCLRAGRMAVVLAVTVAVAGLIAGQLRDGYTTDFVAMQATAAFVYFFVIIVMWFGGFDLGKHALLRGVIGATRQGPWNFTRLLNEASGRNLMQRVGGGYIFAHRLLQDHFAAMDLAPPERGDVRHSDFVVGFQFSAAAAVVMALAVLGVILLLVGLYMSGAVVVTGAILVALAIQWLVIRSAVSSALRERENSEDLA